MGRLGIVGRVVLLVGLMGLAGCAAKPSATLEGPTPPETKAQSTETPAKLERPERPEKPERPKRPELSFPFAEIAAIDALIVALNDQMVSHPLAAREDGASNSDITERADQAMQRTKEAALAMFPLVEQHVTKARFAAAGGDALIYPVGLFERLQELEGYFAERFQVMTEETRAETEDWERIWSSVMKPEVLKALAERDTGYTHWSLEEASDLAWALRDRLAINFLPVQPVADHMLSLLTRTQTLEAKAAMMSGMAIGTEYAASPSFENKMKLYGRDAGLALARARDIADFHWMQTMKYFRQGKFRERPMDDLVQAHERLKEHYSGLVSYEQSMQTYGESDRSTPTVPNNYDVVLQFQRKIEDVKSQIREHFFPEITSE